MSLVDLLHQLSQKPPQTIRISRSGPGTAVRLALSLLDNGRNVVIVTFGQEQLGELQALLTLFDPKNSEEDRPLERSLWEQRVVMLPPYPTSPSGKRGWPERMAALYALRQRDKPLAVLTTPDNLLLRLPPADFFDAHELRLDKGMDMAPELVLEQAVDWGFTRVPMVGLPGEIAARGDILDIFPPGYAKPLRLEFFGDTLDDLRFFDPVSQRSVGDVSSMRILPALPVILSRDPRLAAENFWQQEVKPGRLAPADLAALARAADAGGRELFPGMFYERASRLEDWLPPEPVFILPGGHDLSPALEESELAWSRFLDDETQSKGLRQLRSRVLSPAAEATAMPARSVSVFFEDLRIGMSEESDALPFQEKAFRSFQELFPLPEARERPWQQLVSLMRDWSSATVREQLNKSRKEKNLSGEEAEEDAPGRVIPAPRPGGRLIVSFSSDRSRKRFLKLAEQDGIMPHLRLREADSGVFALVSPFRRGLLLNWENTLVLGEDVLQPRVERAKRMPREAFQGLDRYDSLREGDYLVHRDYGIGVFKGLHRMRLGGAENDYLILQYSGEDKLYLPVDRLSLIRRFTGAENAPPVPDRLGGAQWTTSKDKARKAIEKIAADLVEMYALRKVVNKEFRYGPVDSVYREFEASFGFEETPDQARAIEEVLADMEKPEPMDRLVCGDVGFGKTEVALRAAFRAAAEGRQVALLCPTTVLAEQHYQTFRSRLSGFPVNVGMLSRFVSRARQKEILEAAAKGQVDILIGTHRLLSKDVLLPKLGLLILDEEQRFGVRHKERLKELRKNVDVLTLTATPIPRTLQLSLSGIRELSVIETPPPERKPVATALMERDDATLRGVLERELARQGQVFWVYNRVQGLERAAEYVKNLVPEARIGIAHGQMGESALEEVMRRFWHGELDILVCTSIIESGLDFPRANTLIVDQAQLFGLGQLYQLRGRVGRSDRQAFAVFVTPDPDRLPEQTRQRMRIILDMDYLGAGFQVAMEDLRLRGAGNILGETQTGHMNRLGLELFLEMLEEAVAKLKGQPISSSRETELSLGIPAFIPESYMADSKERLRYYKLLSSSVDDISRNDIVFEMRDRFGSLPQELENFVAAVSFKQFLSALGVLKADISPKKLRLTFAEDAPMDPARLVAFVSEEKQQGRQVRLQPPALLEMALPEGNAQETFLAVKSRLSALKNATAEKF